MDDSLASVVFLHFGHQGGCTSKPPLKKVRIQGSGKRVSGQLLFQCVQPGANSETGANPIWPLIYDIYDRRRLFMFFSCVYDAKLEDKGFKCAALVVGLLDNLDLAKLSRSRLGSLAWQIL